MAGALSGFDARKNQAPGWERRMVGRVPTTTIGGANWSYGIATYQLNSATERVEVFATVYQHKAYIIELQAPDAQFDTLNTSYFEPMLNRFQFQ